MSTELDEVRGFWNRVADDWEIQVGSDGDANRRLNSDPALWRFVGDVRARRVLDAGCGTGYLSITLAKCGARVTGIVTLVKTDAAPKKSLARPYSVAFKLQKVTTSA